MLHTWCQMAALFWHHFSVTFYLCWTIGIPMLYYQYTYAGPLVPECFTLLVPFFQFVYKQYQGELRVLSSFYYSKTYPWGYEGGVRVKKEKLFFIKNEYPPSHTIYHQNFFLDITLLTKSYGRRLIGRHRGISPPHNIYCRKIILLHCAL